MPKHYKVLLGPSTFGELDQGPIHKLKNAGFEVIDNPYKRKLTKEELLKLLSGVIGLIAGLETLDREILEKSELKIISRCGAGLSNVDLKATEELDIAVRNTPTAPATSVAELTIGCLLVLLRNVTQMDFALHNKKWDKRIGRLLNGMEVAVIGYGNIGKKVGQLLVAFGAKVMVVDPLLSGMVDNVPVVDFNQALERADAITLHCSGEERLLGDKEFSLMKKGVYILNSARGSLIDEQALKRELDDGRVAGAWLDTFYSEPYCGSLCDYDQVILTPHIGSYALECRRAMEMEAVDNLIDFFEKGQVFKPKNND